MELIVPPLAAPSFLPLPRYLFSGRSRKMTFLPQPTYSSIPIPPNPVFSFFDPRADLLSARLAPLCPFFSVPPRQKQLCLLRFLSFYSSRHSWDSPSLSLFLCCFVVDLSFIFSNVPLFFRERSCALLVLPIHCFFRFLVLLKTFFELLCSAEFGSSFPRLLSGGCESSKFLFSPQHPPTAIVFFSLFLSFQRAPSSLCLFFLPSYPVAPLFSLPSEEDSFLPFPSLISLAYFP